MLSKIVSFFFLLVFWWFLVLLFSNDTPIQKQDISNTKVLWTIQHKVNKPSFSSYSQCTWVWKTNNDVWLWTQECSVKWKKILLVPQDDMNAFYYAVDSWRWEKIQSLAFQIFDFDDIYTPEEIFDILYLKLLKSGLLGLENICNFEPDVSTNSQLWPVFRLIPKNKNIDTQNPCWEYGDSSWMNKYFIITKGEKSKAVFINQMQKNIFDIQSLQILQ